MGCFGKGTLMCVYGIVQVAQSFASASIPLDVNSCDNDSGKLLWKVIRPAFYILLGKKNAG